MQRLFAVLLLTVVTPLTSLAESFEIDAVHSSVVFRIKHLNVSYAYGRFNDLSGSFDYDPAKPEDAKFEVSIKATSIDTNNEARDKHLRSAELFDVEKFPEITFKSEKVKKLADNQLEVTGSLTLRGVTKPITVKIDWTGRGTGLRGETRGGVEAVFTIKRSDHGMDALKEALGDDVRLFVSLEGVKR